MPTAPGAVTAPPLPPGSYRVYADFVPAGGDGLTLAADLACPATPRAERRQPSDGRGPSTATTSASTASSSPAPSPS